MYRLLIVDDEPLIVNGLVELFSQRTETELEVHYAYSSQEAIELLDRMKMDIVLSDIRMPGISGLELHRLVKQQWPNCKVIFLSGYSDFDYVQEAIRQGSMDYILKTEGNDRIVKVITDTVEAINRERTTDDLVASAREQMSAALPLLQNKLMQDILNQDDSNLNYIHQKFKELQIPLRAEEYCLLMIGRVDQWPAEIRPMDRDLYNYAWDNITKELLSPLCEVLSSSQERGQIIWFIQPKPPVSAGGWERAIRFTKGMLEEIQSTCTGLLKLSVSLALSSAQVSWDQTARKYEDLKSLFHSGLGIGRELILLEPETSHPPADPEEQSATRLSGSQLRKVEHLNACLEQGQPESFFGSLDELFNGTKGIEMNGLWNPLQLELYFSLMPILLRHTARLEQQSHEASRLIHFEQYTVWWAIYEDFVRAFKYVFEQKIHGLNTQENDLIIKIQQYIDRHLSGDLSLVRISEYVGHNPSYLSRLYKKITGQPLSQYIGELKLQRAKQLLQQGDIKVYEIAEELGFLTPQYFHRFFKRATSLTPQEFRESQNTRTGK